MKDKTIIKNQDFTTFVQEIKQKIYSAKSKAILSANRLMIELYFEIGKEIVIKQETLGWGKSVVEKMSKDLQDEFGEKSGYSTQNLWYMRQFYLAYEDVPNLQQLVGEIPWGSNILIFSKCKEYDEKEYYINNIIENGWNRNVLMHHIKTNLFQHERQVENKLVENIKKFLLELGYGFSFVGNQYKLNLGENEYFIDLLFFHRKLNALVAIELKVGKFKPEYAGKMNFYLNILNDKVKMPHENLSIGIILCTDKDGLEVEYALPNVEQAMGVSTYTIKEKLPQDMKGLLPTSQEIKERLNNLLQESEANE
jgi:predicted nuclease of restriction endonuclease-like (RecB) superfamily